MAKSKVTKATSDVTGNTEITSSSSTKRKHVALDQLYIIRDYIDEGDDMSITNELGVHGLRYYNNKLQVMGTDGTWVDIGTSSGTDSCECPEDLKDAGVAEDNEVSDLFQI